MSTPASLARRLCLLALALVVPAQATFAQVQREVLLLHSARRDSVLAETGDRELARLIDQALGGALDYFPEYIDTARFPDARYRRAFRDFLRLKYKELQFDLIIALENTSLDFVKEIRAELSPDAPVVFSASQRNIRRIPNSTGVIDEPDFSRTLGLVTQLQPDTEHVYFVSGSSSRDKFYESLARETFQRVSLPVEIHYLSGLPAKELETRVASLPPQSVVFYAMVSQDGAGENFLPIEYLDRLVKVANRPVYSWVDAAMDHGIVGGSLMRPEIALSAIADLSLRVMRGERADDISPMAPVRTFDQVDWRQLQRWGISEARVPLGTFIRFRELSVWDQYQSYILGAAALLVAQTALIAGLLVQGARRRRAEADAHQSQAALQDSFERIRDLGGRLITAQEAERSRIARELHDDVGQQVALLSMDLELLSASGSPPSTDADSLRETLDRVQGLAKSVHDLSHRLHPAKLRLVGLVGALNSLPREFAQPGTTVTFTHAYVPEGLPQDVTLCLFRVAQEAVQNAIKHGSARNVAVHLGGDNHTLILTIADDGKGFDVRGQWGKGLGLISMSERLDLIGGTLQLDSSPDAGTRVEVSVPFRASQARADSA